MITFLEAVWRELRFALRSLLRAPMAAAVMIAILAAGIGLNTAVYSVLYGILLRPYPYASPERIVRIASAPIKAPGDRVGVSLPDFEDFRHDARTVQDLSAWTTERINLLPNEKDDGVARSGGCGRDLAGPVRNAGRETRHGPRVSAAGRHPRRRREQGDPQSCALGKAISPRPGDSGPRDSHLARILRGGGRGVSGFPFSAGFRAMDSHRKRAAGPERFAANAVLPEVSRHRPPARRRSASSRKGRSPRDRNAPPAGASGHESRHSARGGSRCAPSKLPPCGPTCCC